MRCQTRPRHQTQITRGQASGEEEEELLLNYNANAINIDMFICEAHGLYHFHIKISLTFGLKNASGSFY